MCERGEQAAVRDEGAEQEEAKSDIHFEDQNSAYRRGKGNRNYEEALAPEHCKSYRSAG